jgi:hypothetical protein
MEMVLKVRTNRRTKRIPPKKIAIRILINKHLARIVDILLTLWRMLALKLMVTTKIALETMLKMEQDANAAVEEEVVKVWKNGPVSL